MADKSTVSIGFTGTQKGMTVFQFDAVCTEIKSYVEQYDEVVCHHGDCIGADNQFHAIATHFGAKTHIHPPIDESKRAFADGDVIEEPKKYDKRNYDIVNASDVMLATPKQANEIRRSGTWMTVRYAKKQKKQLMVFDPYPET